VTGPSGEKRCGQYVRCIFGHIPNIHRKPFEASITYVIQLHVVTLGPSFPGRVSVGTDNLLCLLNGGYSASQYEG
jgi:hypothetical protein